LATEQRAARRWTAEAAARRVAVCAVAPLGACFLPAFLLLGVVPVVVGAAELVLPALR
ncbi:MAG: type II secretion protein F, partial [Actinomycetota bacterium]|nr:type II secretion protein F [Actinomycetota bacterium]